MLIVQAIGARLKRNVFRVRVVGWKVVAPIPVWPIPFDAIEAGRKLERQIVAGNDLKKLVRRTFRFFGDAITHRPTLHRHDNLSTDNSATVTTHRP